MTGHQSVDEATPSPATGADQQDRHGADRSGYNRQVLVVGNSPTAVVTAGFLEQAGTDPVLAPPPGNRMQPDTLTLWHPGLVLLERLGLRRPIEDIGTRLDRLDRPSTKSSWTTEAVARPSLLTIRRTDLEDLLDRRIGDRIRRVDRPLAGIERLPDRVSVTLEGGITESFDTVATTDPTLVTTRESRQGAATLHAWAFDWPCGTAPPEGPTERWGEDRAAFSVPVGEGTRVRLLAATDLSHTPTDIDALERRFSPLFDSSVTLFRGLSQHAVRYHRVPRVIPRSVHADGVVLIGPATRASLPGDCLRTALAIEDAWVLGDALAYGPQNRGDALDAYERRRRHREGDLQQYLMADTPPVRTPDSLSPLLSQLWVSRALAFQHVTSGHLPDIAKEVPESQAVSLPETLRDGT